MKKKTPHNIYISYLTSYPEQEAYIARLSADNKARNESYASLLLALPLLSALAFLPALAGGPAARLLALVSVTSLLSTAFLLRRFPPAVTGFDALDRRGKVKVVERSPLEAWLPRLNLCLVVLTGLLGLSGGWHSLGWLPGIVYAAVLAAKMVMASVDPESELSGLKYGYKGA